MKGKGAGEGEPAATLAVEAHVAVHCVKPLRASWNGYINICLAGLYVLHVAARGIKRSRRRVYARRTRQGATDNAFKV